MLMGSLGGFSPRGLASGWGSFPAGLLRPDREEWSSCLRARGRESRGGWYGESCGWAVRMWLSLDPPPDPP